MDYKKEYECQSLRFFAIGCLIVSTALAIFRNKKNTFLDSDCNSRINGFYPILDLTRLWSQVVFLTFCGLTIIMGYFGNTAFIYGAF